jgi:hypothetical protein
MKRRSFLGLVVVLVLLLLVPAVAQAGTPLTFDQAVQQLVAQGYPQQIESHLTSLGTTPLGFRVAGSPSDNAAASYILSQMKADGLCGAKLESVPLDVFTFRGADVCVSGRTLTASQFGGVRGTCFAGISGPLVDVGLGTAADFAAAGSVRDKVVLIDMDGWDWWFNFPQMLATMGSAKAVVMTHAPDNFPPGGEYYSQPNALGSFDAETDYANVPLVYVSRADGAWLRTQLAAATSPLQTRVTSLVDVQLAGNGGHGYNVIGSIPGTKYPGQTVLVSAHHDAWFKGAEDDTSAIAAQLTIARAMHLSGYRPDRTITFLATTGEEFGYTNSWYDWLVGSTYVVTHTHRDWPGRVAGDVNMEWQGLANGWLQCRVNPELAPWMTALTAAHPELLPYGVEPGVGIRSAVYCWNDQWPMTAAGIPSVYMVTKSDTYRGDWYHTTYDTTALIDWSYFAKNVQLVKLVVQGLDRGVGGLLPISFSARANQLSGTVDKQTLLDAGLDAGTVQAFTNQVDRFSTAATQFDASKGSIPAGRIASVNSAMLGLEAKLNSHLTALDGFDFTAYPHEQDLYDLQYLNTAIADLREPTPDISGASTAVYGVGRMYIDEFFGDAVYLRHLQVIRPTYYRANFGALGHGADYPALNGVATKLANGDASGALQELLVKQSALSGDLNSRLASMTVLLSNVSSGLEALTP